MNNSCHRVIACMHCIMSQAQCLPLYMASGLQVRACLYFAMSQWMKRANMYFIRAQGYRMYVFHQVQGMGLPVFHHVTRLWLAFISSCHKIIACRDVIMPQGCCLHAFHHVTVMGGVIMPQGNDLYASQSCREVIVCFISSSDKVKDCLHFIRS